MGILLGILQGLLSFAGGGITGLFGMVSSIFSSGAKAAMQFHQEGVSAARDLGLSIKQSQAYTEALTNSTAELANKYGVTADAIKEVQRGLSDATGRQLLLNRTQTEGFVQLNKLVGSQTTNAFTEAIMNNLGGQVTTVQGAISKAYATAAKQGLNAKKFSADVAKNLTMANKLSFRDGINGIIRMTALSEKLGFNLQSVEAAANKFMDLESSIESSAQLQMLGGAAGAFGSNPLEMMYEANYNPEAFTERMTKTLGGYAQFDMKTGMANVNGMNRDFVKGIANAMGISMDEAMTIAKKQAEVKFKESRFTGELNARFGDDEEKKNYILNNSTYNTQTGRLELNGKDISQLNDSDLEQMMQFDNMSDHELVANQASTLTSIDEQLRGGLDAVAASFAKEITPQFTNIQKGIQQFVGMMQPHVEAWGKATSGALGDFMKTISKHSDGILSVLNFVLKAVDFGIQFVSKHWMMTLGFLATYKLFGPMITNAIGNWGGQLLKGLLRKGGSGIKSRLVKGGLVALGGEALSMGGAMLNDYVDGKVEKGDIEKGGTGHQAASAGATALEAGGQGAAIGAMIGSIIPGLGTFIGAGVGGAIGAVGGATYGAYDAWSQKEENEDKGFFDYIWDKDAGIMSDIVLGVVTGPLGPFMVAAKYWEEIGDFVNKTFHWIGDEFDVVIGYLGDAWDSVTDKIGNAWDTYVSQPFDRLGNWLSETWDGAVSFVRDTFGNAGDTLASVWNGAVDLVGSAAGAVGDRLATAWDGAVSFVRDTFGNAGDVIGNAWDTYVNQPFDRLINWLNNTWNRNVSQPFNRLINWLNNTWDRAVSRISAVGDNVADAWDTYVSQPFNNAINGVFDAWSRNVVQPFTNVINFIRDNWNRIFGLLINFVKDPVGTIRDQISSRFTGNGNNGNNGGGIVNRAIETGKGIWDGVRNFFRFSEGGIVGGDSYSGDKVMAMVNSREMVLNQQQQAALFNFINDAPSMFSKIGATGNVNYYSANADNSHNSNVSYYKATNTFTDGMRNVLDGYANVFSTVGSVVSKVLNPFSAIKTTPFGENSFRQIPSNNASSDGVKETKVSMNDVNVNISGTIRLEGNGNSQSIDVRQLLNDASFVSALKDLIKEGINKDMNGGRTMNDNAYMRGQVSSMSLIGRR